MRSVAVMPFLRPLSGRVSVGPWRFSSDATPVGDFIKGWDPNTELALSTQLSIDVLGLKDDCKLLADDALGIGIAWHSPGSTIRRGSAVAAFRAGDPHFSTELNIAIPGEELASEVRIITQIFLRGVGADRRSPLAATVRGSRLWLSEQHIALEGRGARFPIEVVSFSRLGWLPAGGAWHLEWNKEAAESFLLGSVRLLINEDNEAVRNAIAIGEASSGINNSPIISAIHFDVGRQLILGMLANPEFAADPGKFEKGTVGYHVKSLLARLFPGESVQSLRALAYERAAFFETRLQAKLGLFVG